MVPYFISNFAIGRIAHCCTSRCQHSRQVRARFVRQRPDVRVSSVGFCETDCSGSGDEHAHVAESRHAAPSRSSLERSWRWKRTGETGRSIKPTRFSRPTRLGSILVPPQSKRLACGDVGMGAMAEVAALAEIVRGIVAMRTSRRTNESAVFDRWMLEISARSVTNAEEERERSVPGSRTPQEM